MPGWPGRPVRESERNPDLILHLDHDDGVLPAIHVLTCRISAAKARAVGVPVRLAERGKQFDGLPALYPDAREALEVLLHPIGWVARNRSSSSRTR